MTTEYEQLLGRILDEKKAKLEKLNSEKGSQKQVEEVLTEIRYVEFEMQHYRNSLKLFRSKSVPKVGRWGKPESGEHTASAAP
ncbi:MAG: hypothetical protein OK454_07520 [Thaumarchaeota archaeon]|nr:hypothetical protein [Nitrososphaerota archaeon]